MTMVAISRASKGTVSGSIDFIGNADLEIIQVELGTRLKIDFGNGTASDYIVDNKRCEPCVRIGGRLYRVTEALRDDVPYRVTIHYDNPQEFAETKSVILVDKSRP